MEGGTLHMINKSTGRSHEDIGYIGFELGNVGIAGGTTIHYLGGHGVTKLLLLFLSLLSVGR